MRTGTRPSAAGIGITSWRLGGHQLGQAVAEPRPRPKWAARDVAVGLVLVPVAAGDVEVDPRPALHEFADEHPRGDDTRLTVVCVLQIGALALDQLPKVRVDQEPPAT